MRVGTGEAPTDAFLICVLILLRTHTFLPSYPFLLLVANNFHFSFFPCIFSSRASSSVRTFSTDLEQLAQSWASQCVVGRNPANRLIRGETWFSAGTVTGIAPTRVCGVAVVAAVCHAGCCVVVAAL